MFIFTPKTDDELSTLLPAGDYKFEVVNARAKVSGAGNPQIELQLRVFGPNGREGFIFDYISNSYMQFKIKHFCSTCGLDKEYQSGSLDINTLKGKCGEVKISINKQDGYPDKNNVIDYIKKEPTVDGAFNDEIPF